MGMGLKRMPQSRLRRRRKTFIGRVERELPNVSNEYQTTVILEAGEFTRHPFSAAAVIDNIWAGAVDLRSDTLYLAALPDEEALPVFRIGDRIIPEDQSDVNDIFTIIETPVDLGNGGRTLSMAVMNQEAINAVEAA